MRVVVWAVAEMVWVGWAEGRLGLAELVGEALGLAGRLAVWVVVGWLLVREVPEDEGLEWWQVEQAEQLVAGELG